METKTGEPVRVIGQVQVIGVKIAFGELVVLLVKLALAAIPAAIILTIIVALIATAFR